MLELNSPIENQLESKEHDGAPNALLSGISASPPGALVQLAGWGNFSEVVRPTLRALGFSGLGDYKTARTAGAFVSYRLAPDRILLRSDDATGIAEMISTLPETEVAVLDLSHARWVLRFETTTAAELLARLAPLDFDLSAFPVGSFAQTGINHIGVLIHRLRAERFDVLVPYTWVDSIWKMDAVRLARTDNKAVR
jgi:heterotetrameric sarcosine oxidase gamma subunit